MFFRLFENLYFFHLATIRYATGRKKDIIYYCGKHLKNQTFRLPRKSKTDLLISLRILKFLMSQGLKKNKAFIRIGENNREAIFDVSLSAAELRKNYIKHFNKTEPGLVISKNDLVGYLGFGHYVCVLTMIVLAFIPVIIVSVFSSDKKKYPLLLQETIESFNLMTILERNKTQRLHYFCIYERDANICAYLLTRAGIWVNKVASEVPLYFFNQIVVANRLTFCIAYQQEEYEAYKKTMFVQQTDLWGPETVLQAPERFLKESNFTNVKPVYDLGFFSSGNWLRKYLGNESQITDEAEYEEQLLSDLKKYCISKKLKCRVFLHPIEKNLKYLDLVNTYYEKLGLNLETEIAPRDQKSIDEFDEINLGIALYSTLMFERLALGFKTLIAPYGYTDFPIKESNFGNICVKKREDLIGKLDGNLYLSPRDFFSKNNIENYPIKGPLRQ